jgi:lysophospholipase L1-like esterase
MQYFLLGQCLALAQVSRPAMPCSCTDWPNVGRYASANKTVASQAHDVVFLGDSITEHWIVYDPDFFKEHPFLARGIFGQTTPQILLRFQPDVVALHPKIAVVLAGINDLAGNTGPESLEYIEGNLAAMVAVGKQSHIQVVLSSILPISDVYKQESLGHNPASIRALNSWMEGFCKQAGCFYLDYTAALSDASGSLKSNLTADGIHPNIAGYKVMDTLALAAIRQVETNSKQK